MGKVIVHEAGEQRGFVEFRIWDGMAFTPSTSEVPLSSGLYLPLATCRLDLLLPAQESAAGRHHPTHSYVSPPSRVSLPRPPLSLLLFGFSSLIASAP